MALRTAIFCALLGLSASLEIPKYEGCDVEYSKFASTYKYDYELYGNRSSMMDRKQLFCNTLRSVEAHNALARAGNSSYSQGINQFADWHADELSAYANGVRFNEEQDKLLLFEKPGEYTLEANADFRSRMPAIKNQGQCGSCWAFGAVDVVDFYGGSHSEQQVLDCAPGQGCNGGDPRQALQYLSKHVSNTEASYKYKGRKGTCQQKTSGAKVSSVRAVGSTEAALASAAAKQVVSIAISFARGPDTSFMRYKSGVFDGVCQNNEAGGHAIATVGIKTDYYIVRNSWGSSWGMGGYAYIKRGKNICKLAQHSTVAKAAKSAATIAADHPNDNCNYVCSPQSGFGPPATCPGSRQCSECCFGSTDPDHKKKCPNGMSFGPGGCECVCA